MGVSPSLPESANTPPGNCEGKQYQKCKGDVAVEHGQQWQIASGRKLADAPDQVAGPHRDAARRDETVGLGEPSVDQCAHPVRIIGDQSKV